MAFIQYLDEAMMRSPGDDSTTSDFVVALLRALDFAPKGTMIRTGENLSFLCQERVIDLACIWRWGFRLHR